MVVIITTPFIARAPYCAVAAASFKILKLSISSGFKPATDEYAVMIDARDPLDVCPDAEPVENTRYVESWKGAAP